MGFINYLISKYVYFININVVYDVNTFQSTNVMYMYTTVM